MAQRLRPRRQWLQAAVLCSWLIASTSLSAAAQSGEYRLAVLALESDELQDQFAEALAQALREVLDARSDYTLHQTHVSLAQLSLSQNCDVSSAGCLTAIARSLKLDGFVFGKVTHEGGAPVAVLRRYDLWSEAIDRSALASFASDEPQQPELERAAHKLLDDLLGPAPGATKPHLAVAAATAAPKLTTPQTLETKGSGPSAGQIAGYALLGGAVLTAGLSVLSFVEVERAEKDPNYERYRLAVGNSNRMGVSDVCDEAEAGRSYGLSPANFRDVKETCTRGMTYEVLQFVFLGGAVVSGGLAAFFLSTSGSEKERASLNTGGVSLQPSFGRKGFALNARMKF